MKVGSVRGFVCDRCGEHGGHSWGDKDGRHPLPDGWVVKMGMTLCPVCGVEFEEWLEEGRGKKQEFGNA